jgi:hypothetical protein
MKMEAEYGTLMEDTEVLRRLKPIKIVGLYTNPVPTPYYTFLLHQKPSGLCHINYSRCLF